MLHRLWTLIANWACPGRVWRDLGTETRRVRDSRTGSARAWANAQLRRPVQW